LPDWLACQCFILFSLLSPSYTSWLLRPACIGTYTFSYLLQLTFFSYFLVSLFLFCFLFFYAALRFSVSYSHATIGREWAYVANWGFVGWSARVGIIQKKLGRLDLLGEFREALLGARAA
jgi:hypothetical protein